MEKSLNLLLDKSKKFGATAADIVFIKSEMLELRFRNGNDESLEKAENDKIGLRVFINNKSASVSTNDFSEKNLSNIAKKATEMAKVAPEDKFRMIADKTILDRFKVNESLDLEIFDEKEPSVEEFREKAYKIENSALKFSNKIQSDGVSCSWNKSHYQLVTSNGFHGKMDKSNFSNSIVAIGKNNNSMERDYEFSSKVYYHDLMDPKLIGELVSEKVLKKLNPKKPKTGNFPVIYSPRVARSIASHIASAINGVSITRGTSFLKNSLNKSIFKNDIEVVDNPLLKRKLGSKKFDAEGIATNKNYFIKNGVLKNWILDMSTAAQLNLETSGNATRGVNGHPSPGISNFIISPGKIDPNSLINDISEGFYVTELIGSTISLISGDYSRGASGIWIKNGKLTYPVSEVTIAGNLNKMFEQLLPANDLDISLTFASPTLFIENMVIAGK